MAAASEEEKTDQSKVDPLRNALTHAQDTSSSSSDGANGTKRFVFVGKKRELMQKRKVKCTVNGRDLALFCHDGEIFALDHSCYHAGGPLSVGDIEDIEGKACIICPYHKYKIVLRTGEGLYYSFNPKDFSKPPRLCSKGVKQRTHHVRVEGEDVFVAISDTSEPRDSDYYSSDVFKETMSKDYR